MKKFALRTLPYTPEILAMFNQAFRAVHYYTILFSRGPDLRGSGTLATIGSVSGIVTADHVANDLAEATESFTLVVRSQPHILVADRDWIRWHHVGRYSKRSKASGPDLAFLQLLNPELIERLHQTKSFVPLDHLTHAEVEEMPIKHRVWMFTGGPAEKVRARKEPPTNVLSATHFIGHPRYKRSARRAGFDYIDLTTHAGLKEYPTDYEGISGGGFWVGVPEEKKTEGKKKQTMRGPVFAGVAFYQGARRDGQRILRGHGIESLRKLVRHVRRTIRRVEPVKLSG